MIAASGFLTALERTKFVFGRGSARTAPDLPPPGAAYSALPDPLAGLRGPTSKGGERLGIGERQRKGEREGTGRTSPLLQIPGSAPDIPPSTVCCQALVATSSQGDGRRAGREISTRTAMRTAVAPTPRGTGARAPTFTNGWARGSTMT